MIKTFSFGVLLGLVASFGAVYAIPAVNLERQASIVSVQPNGGTRETFKITLPDDRMMAGRGGRQGFPNELEWPAALESADADLELFKVRDDAGRVVGVASRLAIRGDASRIEWALHLPARGTAYLVVSDRAADGGVRSGELRGGTKEFDNRIGAAFERFVADEGGTAGAGVLELVTTTVLKQAPNTGVDEA